jgi:hypothetical protein
VGATLALPSGVLAGALGALLGSLGAQWVHGARVRLLPGLALAAGCAGGAVLLASGVAGSELPARVLGLRGAIELADALRLGGAVLGGVLGLRLLALRARAALALEAVLVAAAVAVPVAAHRDGMIARPLEIADWFWQRGLDPVLAFVGLGLVAALLVGGTLARGRHVGRSLVALLTVLLLGGLLAVPLHWVSLDPSLRKPLVGGGEGEEAGRAGGGGQPSGSEGRPSTAEDDLEQQRGERGQQRPVAVVIFHKDVEPFGGVFYFRHAAFSQFNGTRLVESAQAHIDPDAPWRFPSAKTRLPGPPEGTPGRTSVATDVALLTEHRRMFTLTDPVEVAPMKNPAPARFKRAYRVVSSVVNGRVSDFMGRSPGDPSWSPETFAHYTEIPEDPRYLELAARIDQGLKDEFRGDPMARALAVKQYLEETTIYSFEEKYTGEDPTAEFLFGQGEGDRKGYCTHLSHAAAFLLRALGVPSRVSAGYGVMAENLRGGSALLVKNGDAHAWVEIYLGEIGWVPVEIVPERTEFTPPPFQEEDLQRLLGEMAREEGRDTIVAPDEGRLAAVLEAIARAVPWLLLAALGGAYLWRGVRLLRPAWAPEAVGPAYRAALDRLAAHGWHRRGGESRDRFAHRAAAVAPSLVPLTRLLEAEVLGGHRVGRAPGGRSAGALAKSVGRELAAELPAWRRLLAMLHPAPWLWSR